MKKADKRWPIYLENRKNGEVAYLARFRKGQHCLSKSFPTKIKAINWLKEMYAGIECKKEFEKHLQYKNHSIKWLCEYWLGQQSENLLEASSLKKYRGTVEKHIIPHLKSTNFQELTYSKCQWWMEKVALKTSRITTNECLRSLKKIYNDAIKYELIQSSPISSVPKYKIEEKEFQFFNFEEKSIFLNFVFQKYSLLYPLFLTALSTGMRSGELQGLLWDCVDFTIGQITVKRTFCNVSETLKSHTKTKRIRRIPMNSQVRSCLLELKNYSSRNALSDYVFPEDTRPKLKRAYIWFTRICKEAGVTEIRFHDMRHTFASHFMMAGGGIYDLQKMLGHSSIEMTERYSHLSPGHLKGVTEILTVPVSKKSNVVNIRI